MGEVEKAEQRGSQGNEVCGCVIGWYYSDPLHFANMYKLHCNFQDVKEMDIGLYDPSIMKNT